MKNIVLTLIISFLTLIATAQEAKPTKEETLNYIMAKFSSGDGVDKINEVGFIRNETIDYDRVSPIRIKFLKYKDITDIQYEKSGDNWRFIFGGNSFRYLYVKNDLYKKVINPDKSEFIYMNRSFGKEGDAPIFDIFLSSSIPEVEIKKYVKALKHLATLHNAKLIKEDLFKN